MKKTLIAFVALFVINFGCKKITDTGDRLCACSPAVPSTFLSLVIKDHNGADLLNAASSGYFAKGQIQLYSKDASGAIKQIEFAIRPPFSYGTNDQFKYYQLFSVQIGTLVKSVNDSFYLKLGDNQLYELNLKINNSRVEKLLIDKVEAPLEQPIANSYNYVNAIFSLKI